MTKRISVAAPVAILIAYTASVADFDTPGGTNVQEQVSGEILTEEGGVTPEPGDQIGAFFDGQVVGLFNITDSTGDDFSITVNGDDPDTPDIVEGPTPGQQVTFRFFDSSTDQEIEMTPINSSGEPSNYIFDGAEPIDFPIQLPGLDLIPSRTLDLLIGGASSGGEGGDAGGGPDAGQYDVNADGKVDTMDAAQVLRVVTGASTANLDRADVNGDGVVSSRDAIAVLQSR